MHVLMLNHNVAFTGGGTFYRALHFARHLAASGQQVTVVCSDRAAHSKFAERQLDGVRLVLAPGSVPTHWRYGYDFYEVWRRVRWVRAQPPFDIVHAFDSRPVVIYPALAAKRAGARLVMDWCDWFGRGGSVEERRNPVIRAVLRPVETYYEEAFRREADSTTVINGVLAARARSLGVDPATILQLPSGADVDGLGLHSALEARAAVGLPTHGPLVGYLGSLFPADAVLLTEAWRSVLRGRPDAQLMLIGHSRGTISIARGVVRTGFVDYHMLGQYLSACDVLCLPLTDSGANRGRWPSKLMDYFAAGRPSVVCDVGETGAIVREARAGLVAEPNASSLAAKLMELLSDQDLAQRLGRQARAAAEGQFSWAGRAGQLSELYRSLS
jgi:glycosyltransferase involved in cell wall biosynthesis